MIRASVLQCGPMMATSATVGKRPTPSASALAGVNGWPELDVEGWNGPIEVRQKWPGHRDINMTIGRYAHLSPTLVRVGTTLTIEFGATAPKGLRDWLVMSQSEVVPNAEVTSIQLGGAGALDYATVTVDGDDLEALVTGVRRNELVHRRPRSRDTVDDDSCANQPNSNGQRSCAVLARLVDR